MAALNVNPFIRWNYMLYFGYSSNFRASRTDRFFQPTIDCMFNAVLEQKNSTHKTISVGLYMLYISLNKFPKPSSVISACSSRWFSWQLVIHQITCSPWTKHHDRSDSFVLRLKTRCKCSSRSSIQKRRLIQKKSCFGWRDLILLPLAFPNSHTTQIIQTTNIGLKTRSPLLTSKHQI